MLSYLIKTHKCFQHFCSLFWDDETEDVEYCRSGLIYRTDESTEMKRSKPLGWFFKDLPGLGIKRLQSCLRLSFYRSYLIIMTNDIMKMNASLPSCYEYTSRTHDVLAHPLPHKTWVFQLLFAPDPFKSFRRTRPEPLSRAPSLSLYCVLSESLSTEGITLLHTPPHS
jgi:hypothetical protein